VKARRIRLALLTGLLLLGPVRAGAADDPPRAIWAWEPDSYIMLLDEVHLAQTIAFLKQQGISTIYLYADSYLGRNLLRDSPEKYHRAIAAFHEAGFRVYALLGSAYLRTQEYVLPEKREAAMAMFQRVLAYNAGAEPVSRFDGINLDIEPYLMKAWKNDRATVELQYLELSRAFMKAKHESGLSLLVGPAMPFWFDSGAAITWRGAEKPLHEHVQDVYDYVTIMDYRDKAGGKDGMIRHVANEMTYAQRIEKPVVIGVETHATSPEKVTFQEETEEELEHALEKVTRAYRKRDAFSGFAIHHLASYREWLARQGKQQPEDPGR